MTPGEKGGRTVGGNLSLFSGSGKRPKYLWLTALLTGLWALTIICPAGAQEEWDVTAKAFVIMDAQTGRILLSNNSRTLLPPASTLKIMTAMYVLDRLKMDDQVRISAYAAAAPPSKINVKEGEVYTVRELMYALLLSSANDGARALAEKAAGSEVNFCQQVTQQVRQWGAYRTTVCTANGLPNESQYTSAEDLAFLFRRAMQNPEFAKIVSTKNYDIQGGRDLRNHDRFLFTTPLARGGKTGYTRASQHTYVGMFQNQDKAIIVAMLGSKKKWADLRTLIEKGFALEGKPIAKLEPLEERLRFARNHLGNSVGAEEVTCKEPKKKRKSYRRKAQVSSRNAPVAEGSLAAVPNRRTTRSR
jgi:D-alanyl-D-alanine carboxypeptidase (penicillin-binding protein 5/6)